VKENEKMEQTTDFHYVRKRAFRSDFCFCLFCAFVHVRSYRQVGLN